MDDQYLHISCKNCGHRYRIKPPEKATKYRCRECYQIITVEPEEELPVRIKDDDSFKKINSQNPVPNTDPIRYFEILILRPLQVFLILLSVFLMFKGLW